MFYLFLIGICGPSGSGKTTLAEKMRRRVDGAIVIGQDAYYRDRSDLSPEDRDRINFDHPDAFDTDLLFEDLARLKAGEPILRRAYDFTRHLRADTDEMIYPSRCVIFEGIHAFADPRVRNLMDLKIYLRVDPDICLLRRIERDQRERGRTFESISRQYLETVRPMYDRYVRHWEAYADLILTGNKNDDTLLNLLSCYISKGWESPISTLNSSSRRYL